MKVNPCKMFSRLYYPFSMNSMIYPLSHPPMTEKRELSGQPVDKDKENISRITVEILNV
jgi:hypothetical protein